MSIQNTIDGLEHQLKGNELMVARAADVEKLLKNPLFRKVILEQFCVQECARYVQESGDPMLPEIQRADALALAQSAGHLRRWFDITLKLGEQAETSIHSINSMLDDLRSRPEDEA